MATVFRPTFRDRVRAFVAPQPERKETTTMRAIIPVANSQPRWTQINYEAAAREGFGRNPYVFGAITQISMAFAGLKWNVYKDQTKKVKLEKHPMLDLLNRPNTRQGKTKFFENFIGYLSLDGNNYMQVVAGRDNQPAELHNLRPDRVSLLFGNPLNPILGYIYALGNVKVVMPEETIRHFKTFNPLDDFKGMSPMMAAAMSIDQGNASKAWNVGLLQNGARPQGAMVSEGKLDDEQYTRLKQTIQEEYSGFMNAGRPLLLEAGVTWQEMGIAPKDMDWINGQKLSSREIGIVYNIAPELIGDSENKTYSNYGEARVALYQENVLPKADWTRDELNAWLSPQYDDIPYCDYDKEDIEALQEDRDQLWTRADKAFTSGWITLGAAQKMVGEDVDPEFGDSYVWELPQRPPAQSAVDAASANLQAAQLNAAQAKPTVQELDAQGNPKQPTAPRQLSAPSSDGTSGGTGEGSGTAPSGGADKPPTTGGDNAKHVIPFAERRQRLSNRQAQRAATWRSWSEPETVGSDRSSQ